MMKKPYSTPAVKTPDRKTFFDISISAVEKIIESLDTREHSCNSCGCTVWENRDEHKAWLELTGMKSKLLKWSQQLPNK